MTNKQAEDLTEFLMSALHDNGFGDIANEINDQLKENFEEINFLKPMDILLFSLRETIQVFNSYSNRNFNALLSRLNEHIEGTIEGITLVLSSENTDTIFNLKELPDYTEISGMFEEILGQISNDNNTNNDIS